MKKHNYIILIISVTFLLIHVLVSNSYEKTITKRKLPHLSVLPKAVVLGKTKINDIKNCRKIQFENENIKGSVMCGNNIRLYISNDLIIERIDFMNIYPKYWGNDGIKYNMNASELEQILILNQIVFKKHTEKHEKSYFFHLNGMKYKFNIYKEKIMDVSIYV